MFGKKNQPEKTALDLAIENKIEELYEANALLQGRTETVIIKSGALQLYPDGADKNAATKDLNEAKYSLLCGIGHYDDVLNQLKNLMRKDGERVTTLHWTASNHPTSHEVIENTYRNFFKTH